MSYLTGSFLFSDLFKNRYNIMLIFGIIMVGL